MRSLAIAATGMNAQQLNVDVIANNIANINTTAYKRARGEFTDLLYQVERAAGVPNRGGQDSIPEGARVGLGVRTAAVRYLHIQGALVQTGNKLDVALNGRGWFQVQGPDGESLYTRAGAFNRNENGEIVTTDGLVVQPAMVVPVDATEVVVNQTGQVFVRIGNQPELTQIGQFTVANFINDAGLDPLGGNLYRESTASGPATARRCRRCRLRHRPAGLSGELQRRSGEGNHRADPGPAPLRNEFEGDPDRRQHVRHGDQPALVHRSSGGYSRSLEKLMQNKKPVHESMNDANASVR